MSRHETTGVTIGLVVTGLLLATLIMLPTQLITLTVLGSELSLELNTAVQLGIILTALVCASSDLAVRSHPDLPDRSLGYTVTFWILPAVLTLSSFFLLPLVAGWALRAGFIGLVAVLLYTVIAMQYHSLDRDGSAAWPARISLQIAVYLAALLFFIVISSSPMRAIVSATAVLVVSALLSLELVRELESRSVRIWFYALIIGLMMSEFKWILNYIKIDARIGGALLLILYYYLTGLTRSMLQKRLTARIAVEYSLITLFSLLALAVLNRWL